MEAQWKRQKRCCGIMSKVVTFDLEFSKYRQCHGYPKYLDRLMRNKNLVEAHCLDDLYKASLNEENEVVKPVYS